VRTKVGKVVSGVVVAWGIAAIPVTAAESAQLGAGSGDPVSAGSLGDIAMVTQAKDDGGGSAVDKVEHLFDHHGILGYRTMSEDLFDHH
jgi:hypothetical protein